MKDMYELTNEARILDLETELFGMGMDSDNVGAHNEELIWEPRAADLACQ